MGLRDADLQMVAEAGLLHDIGKIVVPPGLLGKPARLDENEWLEIRRHPAFGAATLRRGDGIPAAVIAVTGNHHERLDGTGYPNGISGRQIDDLSQLCSVVDVHVALTEPRAYKPAMADEVAFALMLETEVGRLDASYLDRYREIVLDTRGTRPPAGRQSAT